VYRETIAKTLKPSTEYKISVTAQSTDVHLAKTSRLLIPQRTKELIHLLLQGKFALADIVKITGVSEQWLYSYLNQTEPR
jgi:hypothetical protein